MSEADTSDPSLDLFELLLTQVIDGAFVPLVVLAQVVHRDLWDQAVAQHGVEVVATAAVLYLLETRFADRRDEWRAAGLKAERFLAGHAPDVRATCDSASFF